MTKPNYTDGTYGQGRVCLVYGPITGSNACDGT